MIGQETHPGILGAYLIADEIEEMMKKEENKDAREKREKIKSQTSQKTAELLSA